MSRNLRTVLCALGIVIAGTAALAMLVATARNAWVCDYGWRDEIIRQYAEMVRLGTQELKERGELLRQCTDELRKDTSGDSTFQFPAGDFRIGQPYVEFSNKGEP